jgi:hypothetical protein
LGDAFRPTLMERGADDGDVLNAVPGPLLKQGKRGREEG